MNKKGKPKINMREMLEKLASAGFFDEWRTVSDVLGKLDTKGFTVKGKKIGMISRILTQMCQGLDSRFERKEIPKENRSGRERWMFRKVK